MFCKKLFKLVLLACLSLAVLLTPQNIYALGSTNSYASYVLGQPSFYTAQRNANDLASGFYSVEGVSISNGKLLVTDSSRVMLWNSVPTTNQVNADIIIGQPSFLSESPNFGGVSSSSIYAQGLAKFLNCNGTTRIAIVDGLNSRVLIYNTIPTTNGAGADVVVGQSNMTSNSMGFVPSASNYIMPSSVTCAGDKLIVSDWMNNRVLIYNSIPTSNGASADVVIGQPDMTSSTANNGGLGANTLSAPEGVYSDGTRLFIVDNSNNRVLIYNSIPTSNGASANYVIGQPDMISNVANNGGVGSGTLWRPTDVYSDGTKLFIADATNNRVLIYNSIPTSNGASANYVIGQPDMTSNTANNGGIKANSLNVPTSISGEGAKIAIGDINNARVLIYNTIPTSNGANADVVVGHSNFTIGSNSYFGNYRGPTASTINTPRGLFLYEDKLFVVDTYNSRLLIYNNRNSLQTFSPANVVVGQPDMTSYSANNGGISAATNNGMEDVSISPEGKLCIADDANNRVLIYNTIPTSNGVGADVVVGQPDMTSGTANNGGIGADTISRTKGISCSGSKLIISDISNNRVLIYNSIPVSDHAGADYVVGQPDMTSSTANNGGLGANTLNAPMGVYYDGTRLFIADSGNNRVLIYNSIPTSNGESADFVIGQPNMTSSTANNGGISASSLKTPTRISSFGTKLIVADTNNSRVLIYNSIPTANGAVADTVIGQSRMTTNTVNYFGANVLTYPRAAVTDGETMFIAEEVGHSVLIYNVSPQNSSVSGDAEVNSAIYLNLVSDDASEMIISENADFSGSNWEPYNRTKQFLFSILSEGSKTLYVKLRDGAKFEGDTMSTTFTYDNTSPKTEWTDSSGNSKKFESKGGDNIYTEEVLPTFSFSTSDDISGTGIAKYRIILDNGKMSWIYIDNIDPLKPSDSQDRETDNYHIWYDADTISVHSKKISDKLEIGKPYKWKVEVRDRAGNTTSSDTKILRVRTYNLNFSGGFFPLTLLSISNISVKNMSNLNQTNLSTLTTHTTTPIFFGIAPVGSKIKIKIGDVSKEAVTDSTSRFKIAFTKADNLKRGTYTFLISATNTSNDYTEISGIKLIIGNIVSTIQSSVRGASTETNKETPTQRLPSNDTVQISQPNPETETPKTLKSTFVQSIISWIVNFF
jgi:hypothetical protein